MTRYRAVADAAAAGDGEGAGAGSWTPPLFIGVGNVGFEVDEHALMRATANAAARTVCGEFMLVR